MKSLAEGRSNKELSDWLRPRFQEFNRQFFGGELPEYEVNVLLLFAGLTIIPLRNQKPRQLPNLGNDLYGLCVPQEQLIFIDPRCSTPEDVREVLLHEMCHAEVYRSAPVPPIGDPHGREFVAVLRRLAALGEAWASEQVQYYQTVPLSEQTKWPLDFWRAAD